MRKKNYSYDKQRLSPAKDEVDQEKAGENLTNQLTPLFHSDNYRIL
jgi:hypothetical protein